MTDLRNLNREDELLTMLEEQQDQIESLEKNLNSEKCKHSKNSRMISELSSANSEMKKELQKKSETIKSLNETIGKLSESDKVLKTNEQLAKENLMLRMREKAARKEVDDKLKSLDCREKKAATLEKELSDMEKHLRKEVNKKVEKKLAEKKKELLYSVSEYEDQLDYKYRMLEAKYKAGYIICLIYGIVVTVILMIKNHFMMNELKDFGQLITNTGGCIYRQFTELVMRFWKITLVGNDLADRVISIVIILICFTVMVLLIRLLWKVFNESVKPVISECTDRYFLITTLIILVVNMLFGNMIKSIVSINLILSMICEMGVAMLIRCVNKWKEKPTVIEIWHKIYPVLLFVVIIVLGMIMVIRCIL